MLLLVACGEGSQIADTPTEVPPTAPAKVKAAEVAPASTPVVTPTPTETAPSATPTLLPTATLTPVPPTAMPTSTPTAVRGVPLTSASAITSPPLNMEGINTHTEMYGTGADPNIITLGPKVGGQPDWEPYSNKTSMVMNVNYCGRSATITLAGLSCDGDLRRRLVVAAVPRRSGSLGCRTPR